MPDRPSPGEVEAAARLAYGRLVALLTARSGDLAGAEDALGDALLAALERWPEQGVPANPQAWLLTVARRRQIDRARRAARADAAQTEIERMHEEAELAMNEAHSFPDRRLGLMVACAHPAVDPAARTPLMLQAILGLSAERMAPVFLTSPAAMTKRLVRAKLKIAASRIGFAEPEPEQLAERLDPVLDALYAAFTVGRDDRGRGGLAEEALWLGRLLVELAPEAPEASGLLALMLFVTARVPATPEDSFIPLSRQNPADWNTAMMEDAETLLRRVVGLQRPGRFQVEAAIQAVHADRRRTGRTDWAVILRLYEGLAGLTATVGAHVAWAAALAQSGAPDAALARLAALDPVAVAAHQPFWATRAFALAQSGLAAEAGEAYLRAAALAEDPSLRAFLLERRARLQN
jgi:RNA polymerase sigma-70 factor, ECF subfamily